MYGDLLSYVLPGSMVLWHRMNLYIFVGNDEISCFE